MRVICARVPGSSSTTRMGWVLAPGDWKGFLARLAPGTLDGLRPTRSQPSDPLEYGA